MVERWSFIALQLRRTMGHAAFMCEATIPETAETLRRHPRFPEFRMKHISAMIPAIIEGRSQNRLIVDGRHQVIARLVVGLHAAARPDAPETWATMRKLQAIVSRCRLASARHVTEVVGRLRSRRLVDTPQNPVDRRSSLLIPAPGLVENDRAFVAALIGDLGVLFPDPIYGRLQLMDQQAHAAFRGSWAYRADRTVRPFWDNPEMRFLYSRSAGMPALFVILREQIRSGRCDLSFAEVGAMLGVSRTQVRNIFIDDAAEGLFELSRPGGGIRLLPAMVDAFDKMLSENAVAYNSIVEDIAAGEPPMTRE